jgi:hypothetical protein
VAQLVEPERMLQREPIAFDVVRAEDVLVVRAAHA